MEKDYKIKDDILLLLTKLEKSHFLSAKSISEHFTISKQRATTLLEEIFINDNCKRYDSIGGKDFWYVSNEDTKPFLDSGGYTKIALKDEEKDTIDLLQKRFIYKARYWPFIISGISLIGTAISICIAITASNYTRGQKEKETKKEQTQQETMQNIGTLQKKIEIKKPAIDSPKKD